MVISKIAFELGQNYEIEELKELKYRTEDLLFFKRNGITNFSRLEKTEYEIIYECVKKTIKDKDKNQIKKVIFITSSFDDYSKRKHLFSKLLVDLDLKNAIPLGIFLSRCNNYSSALQIAKSILIGEKIEHVLIVSFDWVRCSSKTPQIMSSNSSVLSDGVVSFMVSMKGEEGYRVLDIALSTDQTLYDKEKVDYINQMKILMGEIKKISKTILDRNSLTKLDFKYFITGNYNLIVQKNYALLSGFDFDQIYLDNISSGHAFSSDQLISLGSLEGSCKIKENDKIFLLGTGDYYWGAVIVEKLK